MRVSGWIETEEGGESFSITGRSLADIALKMINEFPEDAGHTDMEADNEAGNDITQRLYNEIHKIRTKLKVW